MKRRMTLLYRSTDESSDIGTALVVHHGIKIKKHLSEAAGQRMQQFF